MYPEKNSENLNGIETPVTAANESEPQPIELSYEGRITEVEEVFKEIQ